MLSTKGMFVSANVVSECPEQVGAIIAREIFQRR
jgi:hypothetical protein